MAMVVESNNNQVRGCAEFAHDVRMVVKHTFLELVEDDEFGVRSSQNARHRSSSEPRKFSEHMVQFDKLERKSVASTQANDTDDEPELMSSDDEEPTTPVQAPPGVWAQAQQPQGFIPVCVAFVPVMQQPVWKKSSRSARRRRARAMNRWFRYNMQNAEGEQQEGAFEDDLDDEFDDEWQLPADDAESPELDTESWPMTNSPSEVHQDKKKA